MANKRNVLRVQRSGERSGGVLRVQRSGGVFDRQRFEGVLHVLRSGVGLIGLRPGLRLLLAVSMSMLLLVGCARNEADGLTQVKVGEVTRSLFYAPQYAALANGFFAEEGLRVELTTTFGGDKTMTALLAGTVDIALVGAETSIYVAGQGARDPVLNFAQLTQTDGTFLVSRVPRESFDWEQLKGSNFLGQRKGGMPQMAGEFTLKKHGIDPAADLNLIQNVDFANIPTAFVAGTGDYVQLFEPQASIFEQEGRGYVVASFGVESGHLPYTVYMARQSWLEAQPELAQKFTNALYKAQQWIAASTAEVIAEAVGPYFPDTDQAIMISAVQRYKIQGSYASDPLIDETQWHNLNAVMQSAGELDEPAAHSALVDNRFAEQAMLRP